MHITLGAYHFSFSYISGQNKIKFSLYTCHWILLPSNDCHYHYWINFLQNPNTSIDIFYVIFCSFSAQQKRSLYNFIQIFSCLPHVYQIFMVCIPEISILDIVVLSHSVFIPEQLYTNHIPEFLTYTVLYQTKKTTFFVFGHGQIFPCWYLRRSGHYYWINVYEVCKFFL